MGDLCYMTYQYTNMIHAQQFGLSAAISDERPPLVGKRNKSGFEPKSGLAAIVQAQPEI